MRLTRKQPLTNHITLCSPLITMPKIRTRRNRPPPGFELVEPTLLDLEAKLREAQTDPHEGMRKAESVWPIMRIHHQRSRYVYELYYKRKEISRELYDWLLREKYADANLIAKWKKTGYERLCCVRCIQTRDHNFQTACICRVPKDKLDAGRVVECVHCGCRGCASGEGGSMKKGRGGGGGGGAPFGAPAGDMPGSSASLLGQGEAPAPTGDAEKEGEGAEETKAEEKEE